VGDRAPDRGARDDDRADRAGGRDLVDGRDGWTIRTSNGALSAHYEETIVITSGAPIVLTASAA